MKSVTFITGNQAKADYLAKYLEHPVKHIKLDLDEIQSLDLREIVEHKVRQAYEKINEPVLVEDSGIEFAAMGRLPGTFVKFFQQEMSFEDICRLLDGKTRAAYMDILTARRCTFLKGQCGGQYRNIRQARAALVGIRFSFPKGIPRHVQS